MKNFETKTKRMCLANIEGKLSVTEMEEIMAGSCSPGQQVAFASFVGSLLFGAAGGYLYGQFVYSAQGNGSRCI